MILNKLNQQNNFRLIICGPPETGKSTLVSYLLAGIEYTNLYIACSSLNKTTNYMLFDQLYKVTNEFNAAEVEEWQEWCGTVPGRKILILDDIIPFKLNRGINKSVIESIFANGRHNGISVIIVLHYARNISPTTRLQYTHLVLTRTDMVSYGEFIKPYCNAKGNDIMEVRRLKVPKFCYLMFIPNAPDHSQLKLFKLIN